MGKRTRTIQLIDKKVGEHTWTLLNKSSFNDKGIQNSNLVHGQLKTNFTLMIKFLIQLLIQIRLYSPGGLTLPHIDKDVSRNKNSIAMAL